MKMNPFRRDSVSSKRETIEAADEALEEARERLRATQERTPRYLKIARDAVLVRESNGIGAALDKAINQGR